MKMIPAIPTTYKGVKFKSRMEADTALLLDHLGIKWTYEKESFLLNSGKHYWPDFHLTEQNIYIEVKGKVTKDVVNTLQSFSNDFQKEIALFGSNKLFWVSNSFCNGGKYEELMFGQCSKCKSCFFCGMIGSYHCRKCDNHEGDHDLKVLFNIDDGFNLLKDSLKPFKFLPT